MRSSLIVSLLVAALAGACCAPARPARVAATPLTTAPPSPTPPYSCAAAPDSEPVRVPLPAYGMSPGKLEVRCRLDRGKAPPGVVKYRRQHRWTGTAALKEAFGARRLSSLAATRCRVVADRVRLGSLAAALGKELGLAVTVGAEVAGVRVALWLKDSPMELILRELADGYGLGYEANKSAGGLHMDTPGALDQRLRRRQLSMMMLKPTETRYVPISSVALARQVAAAFCAFTGSSRGRATLLGQGLLLRDYSVRLDAAEAIINEVEKRGAAGAPFTCTPKAASTPAPYRVIPVSARPGTARVSCAGKGKRCTVEAVQVSAGALGVALASALGQDLVVEGWAVGASLTVNLRDATPAQVLAALGATQTPTWSSDGVTFLLTARGRMRLAGLPLPPPPDRDLELRLIPSPEGWPTAGLVSTACLYLSPGRGRGAAAVGAFIAARGQKERLDMVQQVIERLAEAKKPTSPVKAKQAPRQ